jgi:hypothetical protein
VDWRIETGHGLGGHEQQFVAGGHVGVAVRQRCGRLGDGRRHGDRRQLRLGHDLGGLQRAAGPAENPGAPDYPGNWTGTYRITSCAPFPSPFYEYFCNGFAPGTTGNVSFVMTLAGEAVSGQFRAADMQFSSFVVPVQGDGGIVVSGTSINHPYQFEARWLMNSVSRAQITGTTRWVRSGSAGLVGGAVIEGVIVSLAK